MRSAKRDVIIIGAGPAGCICASYLAKAGVDVLLLEKDQFPRDSAGGVMVSEGISRHIGRLEAADKLDHMSVFINQLLVVSDSGSEALVPFECYGTKRRELEMLLAEIAVSWGAQLEMGCRVTGLLRQRGRVCGVRLESGGSESEIYSDLVIGADGALSFTAKEAGLMREAPWAQSLAMSAYFEGVRLDRNIALGQYSAYGTIFFDAGVKPGYFWIFPAGDGGVLRGHCQVGVVVDYTDGSRPEADRLQARFEAWVHKSPRAAAMLNSAIQITPWMRGRQTYLTQNMKKTAPGLLLIGDAASVMQPLRSDGLTAAADTARAAADAAWEALKAEDFSDAFLQRAYLQHDSFPDSQALKDRLKHRRLIRESLLDPAGVDRAVERIRQDKNVAKRLLKDESI